VGKNSLYVGENLLQVERSFLSEEQNLSQPPRVSRTPAEIFQNRDEIIETPAENTPSE